MVPISFPIGRVIPARVRTATTRVPFVRLPPPAVAFARFAFGFGAALCSSFRVSAAPLEPPPAPLFRFVAISDTQPMLEEQWGQMEDAIRESQALVPDAAFVLFPGDLIHGENRSDNPITPEIETPNCLDDMKRWRSIVDRTVSIPWHAIPGNHEFSTELGPCHHHPAGGRWDRSPVPDDSPAELERYEAVVGPSQWSFAHGGIRFVGINTWENDAKARQTPEQLAWLDAELAKPEPTKIVVGHHQTQGYRMGRIPIATNADLLKLFEKHRVRFYIHGHLHEMDLKEDAGTWHLSLPSTAWDGRLKSKKGWMWFDVFEDEIVGWFKPLGAGAEPVAYIRVPLP